MAARGTRPTAGLAARQKGAQAAKTADPKLQYPNEIEAGRYISFLFVDVTGGLNQKRWWREAKGSRRRSRTSSSGCDTTGEAEQWRKSNETYDSVN